MDSFIKRWPFLSTMIRPGLDFSENNTVGPKGVMAVGAHHASSIKPSFAPIFSAAKIRSPVLVVTPDELPVVAGWGKYFSRIALLWSKPPAAIITALLAVT